MVNRINGHRSKQTPKPQPLKPTTTPPLADAKLLPEMHQSDSTASPVNRMSLIFVEYKE